jgi:tetratricopeptide (TPR) repeat protein
MPEFRAGLAAVCQEMKLSEETITHYQELVKLRPDNAADWNNLGIAYSDKREFDRAIECYRKAIEIDPTYAFAWNNMGNALGYNGEYEQSLHAFSEAISLKPDYAEAYNNRAVTRTQVEQHDAALEDYARALHFRADYSEAHTNRSLLLLLLGQFQAGWTEYEWRWKGKAGKGRELPGQHWDGGPLVGKRILIHAEQGLGDTLQFIRYARELKGRGATVYVECQRPVCKLLSRTVGVDGMFHRGQSLPPIDFHVPMLTVPGLLGTSLDNMPSAAPYVVSHAGLTKTWAERLSRYGKTFNIGIAWQGNPQHRGDRKRSIPLKMFAPLAAVVGVRLFSLQKGFGVEQIAANVDEVPLLDLGNVGVAEDGFLRTAAIMKNLDLIVTADTSVAHLAGAMGVPVWIAMSTACDWRWLRDREDTPWYPSMRLFRQRQSGDWVDVFRQIVTDVKPLVAAKASRLTPSAESRRRAKALCDAAAKLLAKKEPVKAQPLLEEATGIDPENAVAHHDLGLAHLRQLHYVEAAACFRRVLKIDKQHANALANLGAALMNLRNYHEAIDALRDAIRLGAASPALHNNLGAAMAQLGDHAAAEVEYHTALRLKPDYPGAHYNLSHALFAQGRLEEAWVEHEWRWRMPGVEGRRFRQRRWGGEQLDGKTILLFAEQSVSDTILFARFAALAKDRGGRVVLECPPAVVPLMKSCPFVDQAVAAGSELPEFNVQLPLMSIPGLIHTSFCELPAIVPYLSVEGSPSMPAIQSLSGIDDYLVGVAMRGTGEYPGDTRHDVPNSIITALSSSPHIRLINLQPAEQEDKADDPHSGVMTILNCDSDLNTVALVLKQMDLVITADNSIAHIAGALGLDVWTFLASNCHWRWVNAKHETRWYPTMRILRQVTKEEDFISLRHELEARSEGAIVAV